MDTLILFMKQFALIRYKLDKHFYIWFVKFFLVKWSLFWNSDICKEFISFLGVDFIFSFRLLNLNKNFWESSIQLNLTICLDLPVLAASTLVLFIQYTMYSEQNIHVDWIYSIFPWTFCKDKSITSPNVQHILFLHCWIITKNVPLSYSDSVMSLCWMYLGNNLQNVSSSFPHQCILKLKKKAISALKVIPINFMDIYIFRLTHKSLIKGYILAYVNSRYLIKYNIGHDTNSKNTVHNVRCLPSVKRNNFKFVFKKNLLLILFLFIN